MPPRVSILIPTYESKPAHLHAALDSVLAQTVTDWEILIHDDASKTDVRSIVEPYLRDPRIRFVRSAERLGIGGNWNACVRQTSAPFVQYMFQDDLWEPRYLERALAQMESDPRVGFVTTFHRYLFEGPIDPARQKTYVDLEELQTRELRPGHNDGQAFLRHWIERGLHPNLIREPCYVMLKRMLMDTVGLFNQEMAQGLDAEYWLRCLLQSDFAFVPESGGQFRVHGAATSARNEAEGKGLFDRISSFDTLLQALPRGEMKRLVEQSLSREFAKMIQRFFARRESGGKVASGGKGPLVRMVLRHPVLLLKGAMTFFAFPGQRL